MNDDEKKSFKELLESVYDFYGKPPPSKMVLRIWWGSLNLYNSIQVFDAFMEHIKTNKFVPKAAEILSILGKYGDPMRAQQRQLTPPKLTNEERIEGLKKLKIAKEQLNEPRRTKESS